MIFNLDTWNKLPKDAQQKVLDTSIKFETDMKAYFVKAIAAEHAEWEKIGVKKIKFSPEETKKYLSIADSAFMEDIDKKVPEEAKTIRKLLALP